MTLDDALKLCQSKRSVIQPNEGINFLSKIRFYATITNLRKRIIRK